MDTVADEKKQQIWEHFIATKPRPAGVTDRRLARIKPVIWRWVFFWRDVAAAHGLIEQTPAELKAAHPEIYDHAQGNFWGMILEAMVRSGLIKP